MTMFKETGIRQQVIEEIIQIAKLNHVEKVILFGSRARGDYKERSDIDLAFLGGNSSEFILTVDEETSTLLKFDVVDLEKPVGLPWDLCDGRISGLPHTGSRTGRSDHRRMLGSFQTLL